MKSTTAGRTLLVPQVLVLWCAVAPLATHSPAQTNPRVGADSAAPVIQVSPTALDFGLVGVGRTKDLTLTISNAAGGILKGTATAAGPFTLAGEKYSLKPGQSKSLTVRYKPSAPGTNMGSVVLSGGTPVQVVLNGWARFPPPPPQKLRVLTPEEVNRADLIVRYNDDRTSYVLRPPMIEPLANRAFHSIFTREDVLKVAAEQPRREVVIVVLPRLALHAVLAGAEYRSEENDWFEKFSVLVSGLRKEGYQRLVFCLGENKVGRIEGLPVVEIPQV